MSEFTKGEWEYWKNEKYPFWYVGIKGTKRYLATVDNEANARLTAAAPEMYEELIFAMAALRDGNVSAKRRADKIEALLDRIDGKEVQA